MRGFLERRYMLGSGPKEGKCTVKIRETEIILQYYWRVGCLAGLLGNVRSVAAPTANHLLVGKFSTRLEEI